MQHLILRSRQNFLRILIGTLVCLAFFPSSSLAEHRAPSTDALRLSRHVQQSTNIVLNGSFESGTLANWLAEGNVSAVKSLGYNNSYGAQINPTGRISQVINTTTNKKYTVTAWVRINRQIKAPSWGGIRVQITDVKWKELASSPYYSTASSNWVAVNFTFTAISKQSRISFENFSGNGQFDAVFDDALVFLSSSASPTPTPTLIPTATALPPTATSTATPTLIPTATALPPTATSTATPTLIPTATALPPTATSTATPTLIPTATALPPTATSTATPTLIPTATALPPTATSTATPTLIPTATALPLTATYTPTATSTAAIISLITNGGFESGTLSNWENYGGITVAGDAAFAGSYGARLNDTGRIDQSFSTTVGQSYSVRAKLRIERQSVNPSWGGLRFAITNTSWQTLATSPAYTSSNAPINQWIDVSFTFSANSSTSRLTFENFSNGKFVGTIDEIVIINPNALPATATATATTIAMPTATATATATPIVMPTATATAIASPTATATATATTIATPTATATATPIVMPTATAIVMPTATAIATPIATDTATATATPTSPSTTLENFEGSPATWLVASSLSGSGSLQQSSSLAADGQAAALLSTNGSASRAQLQVSFSDSASAHSWEERPGTRYWQRAMVYVPATTVAQLQTGQYFTLASLYPSAGGPYGWQLRVQASGQLAVAGYTADGNPATFPVYAKLPLDRWVSLEIGIHSQAGPGVKRSFAFLLDGEFYGWYRQGNMVSETYNRAAIGILESTSSAPLQVFVDAWQQPGTGLFPTGPDSRSNAALQTQDFRTQSGVQVQYDWSTWALQPTLHAQYGLFSGNNRIQAGRNLDRMPDLRNGWAEIEIDWPQGPPTLRNPQGYFGPMVGFRKEINREQNLEIVPIGNGNGTVDLALEAWVGAPVILARWPMPSATLGGTSIPEPGDIIRVRWEEVSASTLAVRASYYDASAATWYPDIINGSYTLSAVSDGNVRVNFFDGAHTASSITIDSPAYAIRRYTVGTLDTYP